jgi:twinkle protein
MYKSMERADPKHLVNTFIHAHKRYGIDNFVVDNVMTLKIDRGDNTAQADAADMLRVFVSKYPVHLHVVAHPRKPPENTNKPPGMAEIRGASEWGDIPHNIVTVWKDTAKSDTSAEMEAQNYTEEELVKFHESTPCGKLIVRKQRTTGETPMASYFFHKTTKRFTHFPGKVYPMFSEIPWK